MYLSENSSVRCSRPQRLRPIAADADQRMSAYMGLDLALIGDVDHGDIRAHGTELAHQILITALDILYAAQLRGALGGQSGDDQRRAGPQVTGLDGSADQLVDTLDHGDLAVHLNVGAQTLQLVHILEAVGTVDTLGHKAGALCQRQHGGDLGLHIRGEAGVGKGLDIGLLQRLAAAHQQGVVVFLHRHTHLHQLGTDTVHVLGDDVFQQELAAGGSHCRHVGAGLDLVGNDAVGTAAETLHAADLDGVGAGALDVRAHGVQEVGQIHDVRLLGSIFDGGDAVSQRSGHHDVHGGTHGDNVQIHRRAGETAVFGGGVDEAALHGDVGSHGGEALDVLIDGTDAEVAAAGHGHGRLPEAAQQGAQQVVAGADTAGQVVGRAGAVDGVAVDLHRVAVQHADTGAQLLQNGEEQGHVADLGDVLDAADTVHQQGGGNDGDGGIFCTADGHFAKQRMAAMDNVFVQSKSLFSGGQQALIPVCPERRNFIPRHAAEDDLYADMGSIPYFLQKAINE